MCHLCVLVRDACGAFVETVNLDLERLSAESTAATEAARAHLSSMNLPGSLDELEPDLGIPGDVWERIQDTQRKGGAAGIDV